MMGQLASETIRADQLDTLETLLQRRFRGRVSDVRVRFENGGIYLLGWTRTYHAKQLAQHAAMEASGLQVLANEIEVR